MLKVETMHPLEGVYVVAVAASQTSSRVAIALDCSQASQLIDALVDALSQIETAKAPTCKSAEVDTCTHGVVLSTPCEDCDGVEEPDGYNCDVCGTFVVSGEECGKLEEWICPDCYVTTDTLYTVCERCGDSPIDPVAKQYIPPALHTKDFAVSFAALCPVCAPECPLWGDGGGAS